MPRVFISHSSKDNEAAASLMSWLQQSGFDQLFLDFDRYHGIPPGDEWERRLYSEIQKATAVVLLLTRNWFESKWCFAEFTQARALGKSVLPVLVAPDGDQFIGDNLQKITLTTDREGGLARLLDRLNDIALDGPEGFAHPKGRPPYPGMMSFEEEDAAVFFGRGPEVRETLERLERIRRTSSAKVLQLHGESGSGKSSLLKAGVLPQLERRRSEWIVLPYFRPGPRPMRGLRGALRGAFAQHDDAPAADVFELIDAFITDPTPAAGEHLIDLLQDRHAHDGRHRATVLLAIDQFEEAATLAPPSESAHFARALSVLLAPDLRTAAIVTLRTADLPRMSILLALPAEQRLIGPFPLDRVPEIVRKPADAVGLQIEDALVAAIQNDATTADALPLVAYLLRRLYDLHAGDDRLTKAEYDNLGDPRHNLSPIEACIRDAADDAIMRCSPSEAERAALREAFVPGLVRIDERTGQHTRRPLSGDELPQISERLIGALVDERLLIRREDGSIEVAHEALFRVWPPLREWLKQEQEFLLTLNRLDAAVVDWGAAESNERSKALLAGLLLDRCNNWLTTHPTRFSEQQRQLIESSSRARDAARRRRDSVRQAVVATSLAVMVAFGTLALFANHQREEAEQQRELAVDREQVAAQATREARWQAYVAAIRLAESQINSGQFGLARATLDKAPEEFRHWEHGYLLACSDTSQLTLIGHKYAVTSAAFSADGARLVSASIDGTSRVWDAHTGESLATLEGHEEVVNSAAFSPDGKRVVTASNDGTARVWDARTGESLAICTGHRGSVQFAAFHSDGARVITASDDGTACVWDAYTGESLSILTGHEKSVMSAAFSPQGARVVTASEDNTVRVWDVHSGESLATSAGDGRPVKSAAFSPDGARVVTTSSYGNAWVWDARTGETLAILADDEGSVSSAAFSPNGFWIVSASDDRTARVWHAFTGETQSILAGHAGSVDSAAFSPDGVRVVTASGDGTARVWDAVSGRSLATLYGHEKWLNSAVFSSDGARVVTASEDGTARVWDARTGRSPASLTGEESYINFVAFSADGDHFVATYAGGVARVWDALTGKLLATLTGHEKSIRDATFSLDGARVITTSRDGTARVWDTRTGKLLATFTGHVKSVRYAAFTRDGVRIATASDDGTVSLWDAHTGDTCAILTGHKRPVNSIAFSPDGARVLTASWDGTARVWDASTGKSLVTLTGPRAAISCAAFSPDGVFVLSASVDGTAHICDARTGEAVTSLARHEMSVRSAVFSPDGFRVVTASADGTVRISDARTGKSLATLNGHKKQILSAAFSPDGARVLTASWDGTARVWDASTGEPLVTLTTHIKFESYVAFSPDGSRVVTTSGDRSAQVWDSVTESQRYREALQHDDASQPINEIGAHPKGGR